MSWLPIVRAIEVGVVAVAGWGLLTGYRATHLPRYRLNLTPGDLHLPYEPLTVTAEDGAQLVGWLVIPSTPRGIVLVQHGYGTCRADPLALTALVYRGGYAAASIDFRGHGESGGFCTFGRGERLDIKAVLDALAADARVNRLPVAYLGISMGAAVGILAAAEDPRIQAVISDSSYARLAPMVARYQWMTYRLPTVPFGWISTGCLSLELRTPLSRLDPIRAIGRIAPRPVLIIHGEQDASIPVEQAHALYAAAGEPRALWVVRGAGHVASINQDAPGYERRVLEFLEKALSSS